MPSAQDLVARIIAAGASGFDWWKRQIFSLAKGRVQDGMLPDALVIDVQKFGPTALGIEGNLFERHNGVEVLIAPLNTNFQLPSGFSSVRLRLPQDMILHRNMVFPAMARQHLQTAIAFEMDRLTPFNVREVLWNISAPRGEQKSLKFTLLVVPKSVVEALTPALAKIQLFPSLIETASGCIRLAQWVRKPANKSPGILLAACSVLTLVFLAIPIINQQHQLSVADSQLKTLIPQQRQISLLRRKLADYDSSLTIDAAARANGDELQILGTLTNALPDGTWLNQLTLSAASITMAGQSSNAADLISALAASPGLSNPGFTAPVTRTAASGGDLFSLQVSIKK